MPDIAMCKSKTCPHRFNCYRKTATPDEWQYYSDFEVSRDECFIPVWDHSLIESLEEDQYAAAISLHESLP